VIRRTTPVSRKRITYQTEYVWTDTVIRVIVYNAYYFGLQGRASVLRFTYIAPCCLSFLLYRRHSDISFFADKILFLVVFKLYNLKQYKFVNNFGERLRKTHGFSSLVLSLSLSLSFFLSLSTSLFYPFYRLNFFYFFLYILF
jgi:hypothetical protein